MKSVSAAFRAAMKDPQHIEHIRGTIGAVSFDDTNIVSMNYSNSCSDSKDVTFGSARIGQLQATFVNVNIPLFTWRGRTISLEYGLEVDDEHTTEWVNIGAFKIAKADWTDTGMNITAYDCLADFDIPVQISGTVGSIFGFLTLLSQETGVPLGITAEDCAALPNGTEIFTMSTENDIVTYRDMLSWVASSVGGFATATDDGKFTIRSFADSEVIDSFVSKDRVVGSVFSDFVTKYNGVTVSNSDGTTSYYDGAGTSDGVYISIGANPFLQAELDATRARQRQALAEVARGIAYTPFQIAILNCPVYDLGDLVECSGGVAGSSVLTCCIMAIDWTFKNTLSMQGYGADPNLTAGKSKTDKALNSVKKQTQEQGLVFYNFTNSGEIEINDIEETVIVDIDFAATGTTTVMMLHELKMLNEILGDDQTVKLFFYHNDDLINYSPEDTYSEDDQYHFLVAFYTLLNVMGGVTQNWKVTAMTSSGTATIDIGDLKATIFGQKMVAQDAFKGTIKIDDEFAPVKRGRRLYSLTDDMSPAQNPIISGLYPVTNARTTVDGNDRTVIGGDTRTIIAEE